MIGAVVLVLLLVLLMTTHPSREKHTCLIVINTLNEILTPQNDISYIFSYKYFPQKYSV